MCRVVCVCVCVCVRESANMWKCVCEGKVCVRERECVWVWACIVRCDCIRTRVRVTGYLMQLSGGRSLKLKKASTLRRTMSSRCVHCLPRTHIQCTPYPMCIHMCLCLHNNYTACKRRLSLNFWFMPDFVCSCTHSPVHFLHTPHILTTHTSHTYTTHYAHIHLYTCTPHAHTLTPHTYTHISRTHLHTYS